MNPTRSTSQRSAPKRGIAMLLVLATLVLATSAVVALARIAVDARLTATTTRRAALCDQLRDAAESPILDWLHRHAGRLVLPPDAASPRFPVLDDVMELGGEPARITVTAFDQCGMPPTTVRSAATDGLLPPELVARLDRLGGAYPERPGLDLLAAVCEGRVFPTADAGALGDRAATHNPPRPAGGSWGRAVVNINTAPVPLIESVYRARGLGGLDAVLEARAAGRVASPGALRAPRDQPETTPLPVSMSTAWSFRIDCRVGGVLRAWWVVYADTGSNWERVQRLAITE